MKKYWTTKNGEDLKISKMETKHIINCINMIEKKAKNGFKLTMGGGYDAEDIWFEEVYFKGKEALNCFNPQYKWLKEELKRRATSEKKGCKHEWRCQITGYEEVCIKCEAKQSIDGEAKPPKIEPIEEIDIVVEAVKREKEIIESIDSEYKGHYQIVPQDNNVIQDKINEIVKVVNSLLKK